MSQAVEPSPRVTIKDVAIQAGVSVATVSKVINGRYGVAAATVTATLAWALLPLPLAVS